jgi:hypothetical protein
MSTICADMLLGIPHLGMAGWGAFIAPTYTNLAVGEKMCSLRLTGQSGGAPDSALFTVWCA